NDEPGLDDVDPLEVPAGALVEIQLVAIEVDAAPAERAFGLVSGPAGAEVDAGTGAVTWDSTGSTGEQSFTVRVTDGGGLFGETTFIVDVKTDEDAPVVTSLPADDEDPFVGPLVIGFLDDPARGNLTTLGRGNYRAPDQTAPTAPTGLTSLSGADTFASTSGFGSQSGTTFDSDQFATRSSGGFFIAYGGRQHGGLSATRRFELPLIMEAEGGILSIVLEIRRSSPSVVFRDILPGADLPKDVQIRLTGDRDNLRVVLTFSKAYDAPIAEILRLAVDSGAEDPLMALRKAGLELRMVSINGESDPQVIDAAELELKSALPVAVPGLAMDAGKKGDHPELRVDLTLLGAAVKVPGLIDPDILTDGLLPLVMGGIEGITEIRIGLGFDPDSLTLTGITPIAKGVEVDFVQDIDGQATVTVQTETDNFVGIILLAALQIRKGRRGRCLGRIEILSLEADGVDLTHVAGPDAATALQHAGGQGSPKAASGFRVPFTNRL
ncbi:MAG: hypothetical protein GY701_02280, partial [Sulfitobacter sp.]|nr:hypothetical protein [Sulfitobacter sp.]